MRVEKQLQLQRPSEVVPLAVVVVVAARRPVASADFSVIYLFPVGRQAGGQTGEWAHGAGARAGAAAGSRKAVRPSVRRSVGRSVGRSGGRPACLFPAERSFPKGARALATTSPTSPNEPQLEAARSRQAISLRTLRCPFLSSPSFEQLSNIVRLGFGGHRWFALSFFSAKRGGCVCFRR